MKNLNPLKIGKYTFWVSFGIGNLFMLVFLYGMAIKINWLSEWSAMLGFYYLFITKFINFAILLFLFVYGFSSNDKETRKQCFKGIAIILINIPIAILYAVAGLFLMNLFSIF